MIRIFGETDDIVRIEGDVNAEFLAEEETHYLALSDGAVIKLEYVDAYWTFEFVEGSSDSAHELSPGSMSYEEVIDWVVFGKDMSVR